MTVDEKKKKIDEIMDKFKEGVYNPYEARFLIDQILYNSND